MIRPQFQMKSKGKIYMRRRDASSIIFSSLLFPYNLLFAKGNNRTCVTKIILAEKEMSEKLPQITFEDGTTVVVPPYKPNKNVGREIVQFDQWLDNNEPRQIYRCYFYTKNESLIAMCAYDKKPISIKLVKRQTNESNLSCKRQIYSRIRRK